MDQNTLYLLFLLPALFALYSGLLYYDSKVLGMSFETTMELVKKFCKMQWDCDKHKQEHRHENDKLIIKNIFDDLLKQQNIFDDLLKQQNIFNFCKNRSLTVRFRLYFFSPSQLEIWIEKQKKICWSRLYKISKMFEKRLTDSFENACDFWIYIQNLFIDKSHHTICGICGTICDTTVSECWHCGLIQIGCKKCFEERDRCAFCKP